MAEHGFEVAGHILVGGTLGLGKGPHRDLVGEQLEGERDRGCGGARSQFGLERLDPALSLLRLRPQRRHLLL